MDRFIAQLVEAFAARPLQYFHERELHCEFFGLARGALGTAATADREPVHLLRYEYNTLWRYRRSGVAREQRFAERFSADGDVGDIDFALLRREFVESHPYLAVMNKDETIRAGLRTCPWPADQPSPMIDRGLEFKMAHVHPFGPLPRQHAVRLSDFNAMAAGVLLDCRKLAQERVGTAYLVAFSHHTSRNWFSQEYVESLFADCLQEWMRCYDGPPGVTERQLRLLFVLPDRCFRWGEWETTFPHEILVSVPPPVTPI